MAASCVGVIVLRIDTHTTAGTSGHMLQHAVAAQRALSPGGLTPGISHCYTGRPNESVMRRRHKVLVRKACTGTTSFPYKHLPCNKACSSTSADLVGEKGFLTGTITRTHGSCGRKGLPDGDDHSHARIAWARSASLRGRSLARTDRVGEKGFLTGTITYAPTDRVGEEGSLTGTITRTYGSCGRRGLPDGDDHSHARIAWATRASSLTKRAS